MSESQGIGKKVRLSLREKCRLLFPYIGRKLAEQFKAVALIIAYLILFQTLVLGIAIAEAAVIAVGIAVIVFGLAFFMEGLFLGLMPLGETIGLKLPRKAHLPGILAFSLILGIGVTFAEPAIGVLQTAGSSVKAWDAPLLFLLLNKDAALLKWAVGIGVGLAVVAGMLRFMYDISLKTYLFIGVPLALALSLWANFEPNMVYINGLAWDCGGVTTGPVTVPLVLALGIGVSRVVGKGDSESGGFGVVTLASLLPIFTVLILGIILLPSVPKPMDEEAFFGAQNRTKATSLFGSEDEFRGYALRNATVKAQLGLFDGDEAAFHSWIDRLVSDEALRTGVFGDGSRETLERWAIQNGSEWQRLAVFGTTESIGRAVRDYGASRNGIPDAGGLLLRNGIVAAQAIMPLVLFLLLVLVVLLREKLAHGDEVFLGVAFALVGMMLFNMGIELGLTRLGNQVGSKLPSSFKKIELVDETRTIADFDPALVQTAVKPSGETTRFFYANLNNAYVAVPYDEAMLDRDTGNYSWIPTRGPLFGGTNSLGGFLVVILFAFIMGYGATLAEPALNALGTTVENLSAGAFKKSLLIQSVAVGVGVGIAVGVVKIIWGVPLFWLIGPPYLLLMLLTKLSTEEFVNIGWDSAGVTTGPITVPLVLSLGLGIGGQIGAVEGFGILATASAFPILSVLTVGLVVNRRKRSPAPKTAGQGA